MEISFFFIQVDMDSPYKYDPKQTPKIADESKDKVGICSKRPC
jgi:hypothetical protein